MAQHTQRVIERLGVTAVMQEFQQIDGVDYELYQETEADQPRGLVRVFDADSGNEVMVTAYPKFETAREKYDEGISILTS